MEEGAKPVAEHSAEDDARTLSKAHELRRDGKRMKAVRMLSKNLVRAISSGKVGRKGMSGPIAHRIAAGKTGRKGMGPGLAHRIAHGKATRRGGRSVHGRGGR